MPSALTVAVDARPISHPQAGGFRSYVSSLLRGIVERKAAGEPVPRLLLYIDRPLTSATQATLPDGAELRMLSPARMKTDAFLFDKQVRADRPDVVFGTQNYLPLPISANSVVTLHDAMGIKRYEWDRNTYRNLKERIINRYWYYLTIASNRRAQRIVTVSQGSKDEIRSVLRDLPESRIAVVYNGLTLPQPQYTGPRDPGTLLCMASPDVRKNLVLLYDALSNHQDRFGKTPPKLRIVCTSPTTAARTEAILEKRGLTAELLRGLDNQALSDAFARAAVFVWPSWLEGFGMPPLEMMMTGGAVAASNAVCMPEILGDAPIYFSPERPETLADAVRTLTEDDALRTAHGEMGRQRAAEFTCRRMADETIAVWESAAGMG